MIETYMRTTAGTKLRNIDREKASQDKKWLYQEVQQKIKSFIIENSLQAGQTLPTETKLAESLGVSRNSVREAVKALETLGIIKARRGAGLIICSFSMDQIFNHLDFDLMFGLKNLVDIYELRFNLEFGAADQILHEVTQKQLEELDAIAESMKGEIRGTPRLFESDREFHRLLSDRLRNDVLKKVLDIFWRTYHQARSHGDYLTFPGDRDNYLRHANIVKALRDRDLEKLRLAIALHYMDKKLLGDDFNLNKLDAFTTRNYIELSLRNKIKDKDRE